MIVISPHLDDATFSCGQVLAAVDALVVTVCAGIPKVVLTAYDRECGFSSSAEAVEARRREDLRAATVLDVRARHLSICDGQYAPVDRDAVRGVLADVLSGSTGPVLVPLGLGHPDHRTVSAAALDAAEGRDVWVYDELPYRVVDPEDAAARVAWLRNHGRSIGPAESGPWPVAGLDVKRAAVACYRSQTIGWADCIYAPERYRRAG